MRKKLVILTTHFGTNFSGGSTATCEIFSRIEDQFEEVIVIGTVLGDHTFKTLSFIKYENWFQAILILKKLSKKEHIFYGDFYNSLLFLLANVNFFFTYHDNWPELGKTSWSNFLKSIFYVPVYRAVFKRSEHVFVVSQKKLNYVQRIKKNVSLVRNGFNKSNIENQAILDKTNVLMVGNIDKRKYIKALSLFKELSKVKTKFTIDIYGQVNDHELCGLLEENPFVSIKGFNQEVPYGSYSFLLHTSTMENMPIVFCEALHGGIPILTFDVGGSSEIINDSNGILIPCYSIDMMTNAFYELLDNRDKYNLNNAVPPEYSWDVASTKYLNKIAS